MRRLAAFCFVLVVSCSILSADEARTRSFSARSALYEMTVRIDPLPIGQLAYEVIVKDLNTQTIVVQVRATDTPEANVDLSSENNGLKFVIHLHPHPMDFEAELYVERAGALVDKVTSTWSLVSPETKHLVAPGALHVGGSVKAPIVITRVNPIYPEIARKDKIAGIVIVEVLIDKTGNVVDALALKDLPDGLGQAAIDAVKQWKFKPATMNGEPVDVIFVLTTSFKLGAVKPQP